MIVSSKDDLHRFSVLIDQISVKSVVRTSLSYTSTDIPLISLDLSFLVFKVIPNAPFRSLI